MHISCGILDSHIQYPKRMESLASGIKSALGSAYKSGRICVYFDRTGFGKSARLIPLCVLSGLGGSSEPSYTPVGDSDRDSTTIQVFNC